MKKTVDLIRDSGSQPMILISPYNVSDDLGEFKSIHSYCKEEGIAILDMNLEFDETGIDNATDFYDGGHLNVAGAEKASMYIAEYVIDTFGISSKDVDDTALWQEDIEKYHSLKAAS